MFAGLKQKAKAATGAAAPSGEEPVGEAPPADKDAPKEEGE